MKRRDEDEFYVREKRRVGFFSLIELLIVMLVLGILIMLAIPLISGARQAANNVKCRSNLKQLHVAIMAYTIGNKGRRFLNIAGSTDLGILIASGYINKDTKLGNCPGSHEEKVGLNSTAYQGGPKLDGTNALLSESINSNTIILEDVSTAHHKAGKNTILLDGSFTQNGEQIPSQTDSVPELTLDPAFPDLAFALPLDSQHSKDESNRLFVVEQAGIIRVFINKKETKQSNVFLDLSKKVISGGERGLLGIAFHPNYKDNGLFFVNYTANKPLRTFISRFKTNPEKANEALIDSELVILEVEQPYANHNGGGIRFGPDGFLYIGMGDGGWANDPHNHGQDLKTLLGAMLRIDINHARKTEPYRIPEDNPFVDNATGYREEIWAYGLRNPWRFHFDARTGKLWAGDVGQNQYEEVDIIKKGGNYAWPLKEGHHDFLTNRPKGPDALLDPIIEYPHKEGQSITGGVVYHGKEFPSLRESYIYADYVSGKIWAYPSTDDGKLPKATVLIDSDLSISSITLDQNGEILLCAHRQGKLYRLQRRDKEK